MKASKIIFTLVFLLVPFFSQIMAQEDLPEPQMQATPGAPPPPGLVVPIDSGLTILLFSGLFLGLFYLLKFSLSRR